MSDRTNKDEPTGLTAYFTAIRDVFELQTKVLTGALPHYGERGRNDEQRVAKLLEQVLPRKYSLSTGFIVSSHADLQASPQIDIVIHDELLNSPLFRELAANIFPIESVYATVEVKASLAVESLRQAARAVSTIRQMAKRGKYYVQFGVVEPSAESKITSPYNVELHTPSVLSPRSYVVGYDAETASLDSFKDRLTNLLKEFPTAFFHGIYAIRQNWFLCQRIDGAEFDAFSENGLLAFTSKLITDLQSFPMKPMAFSRYVENERLRSIAGEQKNEG